MGFEKKRGKESWCHVRERERERERDRLAKEGLGARLIVMWAL